MYVEVLVAFAVTAISCQETIISVDEQVRNLLVTYNAEAEDLCNAEITANWNVYANVDNEEYLPAQVV